MARAAGALPGDDAEGVIARILQPFALQIIDENRRRAAAQSGDSQPRTLEIVDLFVRFAADQNIRRRVVNAGDDFQVAAFFVDENYTVGIKRAEMNFAGDQCLQLHVAAADENQLNLEILRVVKSLFLPDVER